MGVTLWLVLACVPDDPTGDLAAAPAMETPARDSAPVTDSADSTADTADTAPVADTANSGDTGTAQGAGDTLRPPPIHFAGHVYYAGDPHAHSGFSGDGSAEDPEVCPTCGDFADVFEFARTMGLSWLALADHTNGAHSATHEGMAEQISAVIAGNDPENGFLTVPAAEVWLTDAQGPIGHKTVLMLGDPARVATVTLEDLEPSGTKNTAVAGCDDVWTWAARLQAKVGPVLLVPHHTSAAAPMPTRWSCASELWQPTVEVYSEHGNSLGDDYDPQWSGTVEEGTVHNALDPDGFALHMGFIGGTDSHDTLPGEVCAVDRMHPIQPYGGGLTVAVMPEGTPILPETLLAALTTHSTYATSGPIVAMDVTWESAGDVLAGLGQSVTSPAGQDLELHVRIAEPYDINVLAVDAVGPSVKYPATQAEQGHWTLTIPGGTAPAWLYPSVTLDGEGIYGSSGCEDGGNTTTEFLWGSPSWIDEG